MSLNLKAWIGSIVLAFAMALLIFVPAGTIHYWQGWNFLGVFFGASTPISIYLMKHDRELLRRRLSGGPIAEKQKTQKIIMMFTSLGFIGLMVVPALDYRLGWSHVPLAAVVAADLLIVIGFYIVLIVFKENTFTAATIQLESDQKVITTGPYAIVRHPMYAGSLLYLVAMPVALGSWWGLVVFVAILPFLAWRLFDEEHFLSKNLAGYAEYCAKVRWRLLPHVF